jgi:1,2-phenylacetyl-CoA epoxidase catalytic subunit
VNRKRPSKQALDKAVNALVPYILEMLEEEKRNEKQAG